MNDPRRPSPAAPPVLETARPDAEARRERSFLLLLSCFFLSGFAGLVYETAWTRQFSFVFGTSNLAVATVLAAYMGGLASGAALAGRYANRIRRPVLAYGLLELGVGLSALAVPFAIRAARWLYVGLFGGQQALPADGGLATALFYLVCSFAILLVPTGMMGATLPLLARHAVRSDAEVSRRTGLLYATNTAGAVVGTLAAAFLLLPNMGLGQTIRIAALVNLLVFLAAWGLARSAGTPPRGESAAGASEPLAGERWILPLVLGSGIASFAYEVSWVRLLEHVLGGSVYAFATMLASFLLGIALGSAAAASFATTRRRAALAFVAVQALIALASLAAFVALGSGHALSLTREAGAFVTAGDVVAAMSTLFPAATFIGATFPLAVRILAGSEREAGPATARVYAANTLGSILGAVGAGFFVVPLLGYGGTFTACAALNLLLAAGAALLLHPRRVALGAVAAAAAVGVASAKLPVPWAILLNSPLQPGHETQAEVEYFGVGRAATVLLLAAPSGWLLRSNGLPESGIDPPHVDHNRNLLGRWLGILPVLARPSARSMMVVGLGGGIALESAPSALQQIDVVELEREIVAANRAVSGRRWRDPLADPRVHVHVNDARNALLLTDRRYDAIVSQPSHPWSGGAAHLYTQEFFQLARSRLASGGVFVQWIGLPFVDEALFRSLLATLGSVFENVQVYRPKGSGVLFLASDAPLDVARNAARALREARPDDFAPYGLRVPEDVRAALVLDEAAAAALGRGAPLIRDDDNRLQSGSPRVGDRGLDPNAPLFVEAAARLSWPEAPDSVLYLLDRLDAVRAEALVASQSDPVNRRVARAALELQRGRFEQALEIVDALLAEEPGHVQARALRLRLGKSEIAQGKLADVPISPPYSGPERVVVAGWRALQRGDLGALHGLDPALEAVPVLHALQTEAARLRVEWRIGTGRPERADEAIALVDRDLSALNSVQDSLLRARATLARGNILATLDTLASLATRLDPRLPAHDRVRRRALRVATGIPPDPQTVELRAMTLLALGRES